MPIGMLKLACAALLSGALSVPAAAQARYYDAPPGYDHGYARTGWDRRGPPPPPRAYYRERERDHDRRCDRAGGTILGAIAGGLLGNAAAGRGDRGAGTVVGAGVGALAGRAIDRGC